MSEPCCPRVCDFSPERVRFWLHEIKLAKLSNLDPVILARDYAAPRGERHMGRGGCSVYGNSAELIVIAILEKLPKPYTISDLQLAIADPRALAQSICAHSIPELATIG